MKPCVTALSAESEVSTLRVLVDGEVVVSEWEGTPGATELQEIPGVEGSIGAAFTIQGIMEPGEYLAISEVSQSAVESLKASALLGSLHICIHCMTRFPSGR